MGNLCCSRTFELFHLGKKKVRVDFETGGLDNFDFNENISGIQASATVTYPEYNDEPRDYAADRIRRALMMNDLSSLPEDLRDVTKLSDMVLMYSKKTLPNTTPEHAERQRKITNKTTGHRSRKYNMPVLVNVKSSEYGLEDYSDKVRAEAKEGPETVINTNSAALQQLAERDADG
jgi:hypothetical protein